MLSEHASNRIAIVAAAVLAAGIVAGILVPAGPGWDFANFYDAGHKIAAGQTADLYNEFTLIEGKQPQGHLAFYGTPISALLFAPLAWMAPPLAMIAFKAVDAAAILAALWLLYADNLAAAERSGLGRVHYRAAFLVAALLFQPFWTIFRVGGQTTPLLFLGFVLALRRLTTGRPLAAALVMVAVVAIKPAFILVLIPLAAFERGRFLIYTVLAGGAAAATSIAVMGWTVHLRFLELLRTGMISPWVYNSSISVVFESFRARIPALASAASACRLGAALIVLAVLFRARRRMENRTAQRHFLFVGSALAGLLLMPIVWEHYLSILFIALAYWLAVLPVLGKYERALLAATCLLCCTQNLVFVLWLFERLKGAGPAVQIAAALWKSAPLILFTALLARYWQALIATYGFTLRPLSREAPSESSYAAAAATQRIV